MKSRNAFEQTVKQNGVIFFLLSRVVFGFLVGMSGHVTFQNWNSSFYFPCSSSLIHFYFSLFPGFSFFFKKKVR